MMSIAIIVGLVMSVAVVSTITEHKQKIAKIRHGMLQDEIELEKIKQENFIIETEKLKVELEQKKLEFSSGSDQLIELKDNQDGVRHSHGKS